jgi:predicted anti-sigma-YlaC factor YlaD
VGGSRTEARHHFEKAIGFAGGHRVAPLVAFAETVSVAAQDRPEFEKLLRQALDVDPGAVTDLRLTNLVYQRRARWLLGRADELFIE